MASPQAENGHIDIANEIVDALARYRISGEEWQCLMVIFRKTYGWKKKDDEISLSTFEELTGIKRPNIVRALKKLLSKKIIGSSKNDTRYATKYWFNKDFDEWEPVIKKDTTSIKKDNDGVSKKIICPVSKKIHSKDNSSKDTTSKDTIYPDEFLAFWESYPKKVGKDAAMKAWRKISKPKETIRIILEALQWQKQSHNWTKDNGQYIPNPATYLNQGRWKDEKIARGQPEIIQASKGVQGTLQRIQELRARKAAGGNNV